MKKNNNLAKPSLFTLLNKLITLFLTVIPLIFLSGCLMKNDSGDIIKLTSDNTKKNKFIKVNKTISLNTGIDLLDSGEVDKAITFFKEYEDFYSKNPKFYFYLGQAYMKKGLYIKASENFKTALMLDNKRQNVYLNLAEAYEKGNMKKLALDSYANYIFAINDPSKYTEIQNKINNLAGEELGTGIIGRISLADRADVLKNNSIGIKQAFSPATPIIFASIELINAGKSDLITAKWNYLSSQGESMPVNSSEIKFSGSKTILISINSPVAGWPAGKYELVIFVNGIKNSSLYFYIF